MANRNIAFTITINGIDQTVNNIGELENALKKARIELKNFTGDPNDREKLINQLKQGDTIVRQFNQNIKGNTLDQQIGKFLQLGSLITSTFGTASTVLTALGVDGANLAEAQAKAQQILTVAFTVSEIARNKDTIATVANTVAQIASIAATQGLTAATRAFFLVLKANPLGAVLAVLTAVIGAIIAFTGRTNDASKAEENYRKQLEKTNQEREFQLLVLQKNGATELDQARFRKRNAELDLANARTQLEVYKQTGASQKQVNEEFVRVNNAKKIIIQEEIRINGILKQEEQKLADEREKNAEADKQRRLERIRLIGEERKRLLELMTGGVELQFPQAQLDVEQQNAFLKSLTKTQSEYNDVIDEYQSLLKMLSPIDVADALTATPQLKNQIELTRSLVKSTVELAGLPVDATISNLRDLLRTQKQFVDGNANNYQGYVKTQQDLLKFERDFINSFVQTNIQGFQGSTEEVTEQRKILTEQANVVFDNLIENALKLQEASTYYSDVSKKIAELSNENQKLAKSTEVLNGFLQKNADLLVSSFTLPISRGNIAQDVLDLQTEIQTKRFDQARVFASDIEQLEYTLLQEGIDIRNASYEEKLQLLLKFLQREVEATEDAEAKKQEASDKTLNKIKAQIQAFQIGLQAIQQTVSDYYNFTFDQLEKRNKRIQDTIVGDSEAANKKRLEQDKIYTAERARLEKQRAKIELRIALAQAIANTAAAVAQNIAIPPLAIIVGAAGAAQVAIIAAQINAIDSYQRGGKIRKGQGGMVVGPSHEMGGVKFQGGGIELEGNEAVINRLSTLQYADILSTINQAGGGRPIISNNFDDSRIVEAIAKQRQTPIRAYVVESDISNAQTVNKRLELLSQI